MTTAVYTVEEAAAILRIGRSAAYEAARRGEIPTVRLGRSLRVPAARLHELLGHDGHQNGDGPADTGPIARPLQGTTHEPTGSQPA